MYFDALAAGARGGRSDRSLVLPMLARIVGAELELLGAMATEDEAAHHRLQPMGASMPRPRSCSCVRGKTA